MTKILTPFVAFTLITFIGLAIPLKNAEAGRYKAKCKGPFQLVQGNWIATPLCEEKELVRVARSYGHKHVTLKLIRTNPVAKIGICRAYGHDIRLSGMCGAYKLKRNF